MMYSWVRHDALGKNGVHWVVVVVAENRKNAVAAEMDVKKCDIPISNPAGFFSPIREQKYFNMILLT